MRTVSDSASMLLMTSCFDGWKVSCNEQRAAADAPPWEGCVHPVASRPHETISSAWGMHGGLQYSRRSNLQREGGEQEEDRQDDLHVRRFVGHKHLPCDRRGGSDATATGVDARWPLALNPSCGILHS
jgi:hypothetical protein